MGQLSKSSQLSVYSKVDRVIAVIACTHVDYSLIRSVCSLTSKQDTKLSSNKHGTG